MSINSKARRDAKRRQEQRQDDPAAATASPIEPHAELRDQERKLLAGIVRRDGQWVLGMDGKIAGASESAAHVLALIRRAGKLHEAQGVPVRLMFSDALRDAAESEVSQRGQTMDQFEAALVARLGNGDEGADEAH